MKLSINEPCHENWDNMTPNDKGAFCLSCQKNVVDFSSKTLTQIKDFFKKKSANETVCGRFDERQLDALTFDDFFTEFMKWKFFQKAALIVFFVFGLSLFAGAQTKIKNEPIQITMGAVAYVPKDTTKKVCKKDTINNNRRMIKGEIIRQDEAPIKKKTPKKFMNEPLTEDKRAK